MKPVTDGRFVTWARSYGALEAAQNLRNEWLSKGHAVDENLPPVYYALMQESEAYTMLSQVDAEIGFVAGSWINEQVEAREQTIEREASRGAAAFEALFDRAKDDDCTCSWSRAHCKVHPWPPSEDGE